MKAETNNIIDVLQNKISESAKDCLHIKILSKSSNTAFTLVPDGTGVQVEQLKNYILKWEHFDKIVKKANSLGGKMYREDTLAQNGGKLGEDISHDSMEGFIASELLGIKDGSSVTRRSTYYAGVLAWAEIITIHRSQGKGSYITVNTKYHNI